MKNNCIFLVTKSPICFKVSLIARIVAGLNGIMFGFETIDEVDVEQEATTFPTTQRVGL